MTNSLPTSVNACERYFNARFPGYTLANFYPNELGVLTFELQPLQTWVICPKCGLPCTRFHDVRKITIVDWDITVGGRIELILPVRRLRCHCGCRRSEPQPDWIYPEHRITKRLAAWVQVLLGHRITNSDISEITGVSWNLVKELDKEVLKTHFDNPDISKLKHLAIDEISIHKGHQYATVFMDLDDKSIVRVVKGKSQDAIKPVFEELKFKHEKDPIDSVSVDMNAGFPKMVKNYLPGCQLAYDLFHVIQIFTRDTLVEAKRFSLNKLRQELRGLKKTERTPDVLTRFNTNIKVLSNAQWLVVSNQDNLKPSARDRLFELREHNQLFADLYPLAEMLRAVWRADTKEHARGLLQEVCDLCSAIAQEHEFETIKKFGKMLRKRAEGIINACDVRYGTNMLEGANNTAKVIKRLGYGYRDFEYFALKLKAAFPGKRRQLEGKKQGFQVVYKGLVETLAFPQ